MSPLASIGQTRDAVLSPPWAQEDGSPQPLPLGGTRCPVLAEGVGAEVTRAVPGLLGKNNVPSPPPLFVAAQGASCRGSCAPRDTEPQVEETWFLNEHVKRC